MWPFTAGLNQRTVQTLDDQYDYIVVGGGTAGCVLARRLSEEKGVTVLLVEKGDAGDSWLNRAPLTSHHHFSDGKHSTVFDSVRDAQLGRSFTLIGGLGLGGTTRINGGQYTCGVPGEFNAWSQSGCKGWSYADLKPFFDKSETWIGPVPQQYHGASGPLHVRSFESYFYESSKRAAEAAVTMGFSDITDIHSPLEPSIGWNKMQYTVGVDGTRQSSFRAYLPKDIINSRADRLHVCTKAMVCKLGFSKTDDGSLRVQTVTISSNGSQTRTIAAKQEVVLACGTLQTPKLLMLSGIGPQDHLKQLGIDIVQHLLGVGENLQDHILLFTTYNCPLEDSAWAMVKRPAILLRQLYNYVRHGAGWFLFTMVEMEIFGLSSQIGEDGKLLASAKEHLDPSDPHNLPDFAVMPVPIADPRIPGTDKSKGTFSMNIGSLKTKSYGHLRLRSRDPRAHPDCDMKYLTSSEDYIALRAALRVAADLVNTMRAAEYPLEAIQVPAALDESSLDDFIRKHADTMYHYSSSCRMAPLDDARPGVVDDELRVHGIPNLRISDASVFPNVPATHPQALVYAVAEKCAHMVRTAKQIQARA